MNTIAGHTWNAHHGTEVAQIIDDAARRMREHSPGCELIDGLMADCWDGGDPWGSTVEAQFALEYACQYHGWPTHPEFRSPHTTGDPDNGMLYVELRDAMWDRRVTPDDVRHARTVLDEMAEAFKTLGFDY